MTILFLLLAAVLALGLVYIQYFYNAKKGGKTTYLLSFLRFISWFTAFVLLINPEVTSKDYTVEKANLVVLADNSTSMKPNAVKTKKAVNELLSDAVLNEKYTLSTYSFGSAIQQNDSLSFSEKTTNIANALKQINEIYGTQNTAIALLTDGNQTLGANYSFNLKNEKHRVYPIAIGDTTTFEDIAITRVNANKYAFLKNKFPLEVFVNYNGNKSISKLITVAVNGTQVFKEQLNLSKKNNSKVVEATIEAKTVGVKLITVKVETLANEKNTKNNIKSTSVAVIDEKTKVAIISDISHPDIAALKKAIETNEQRVVEILKPNDTQKIDDFDVFVVYQPTAAFTSSIDYITNKKANYIMVVGPKTDLEFLNSTKSVVQFELGYPPQEALPNKNDGFSKFDVSKIQFANYPPLESSTGPVKFNAENEAILSMILMGEPIDFPLVTVVNANRQKAVYILGENIWKWRVQAYRDAQDFSNFDDFVGQLMVYLSDNQSKERLTLDYKLVYEGSYDAKIRASYFDEVFQFDANAVLEIKIKGEDGSSRAIPMLLKNSFYEADLSALKAGEYQFVINVKGKDQSKSGKFTILDFDIEQQFSSTNYKSLQQLAVNTGGILTFDNQIKTLITQLKTNEQYTPIRRGTEKVVPLIDFKILLGLLILSLALEWFIRKYNGLI